MATQSENQPDLAAEELDSDLLEAVRNLSFLPHLLSSDSYSGIHDGKNAGSNMEFSSHRQYEPGDDLRYLDWNVLAKTGEAHLKQFESENRINASIVADASNSMDFTSEQLTKWEMGRALAVMCGAILLQQQDRVKFTAAGESGLDLPVWSAPGELSSKLDSIKNISPAGRNSLFSAAREQESKSRDKKLWIFISDFWLPELEDFVQWLKTLQSRGHRALLLGVRDPVERRFEAGTPCRLRDMETGETVTLSASEAEQFSQELHDFQSRLKSLALQNNINYWNFFTDRNPVKQLHSRLAESSLDR